MEMISGSQHKMENKLDCNQSRERERGKQTMIRGLRNKDLESMQEEKECMS